MSGNDNLIFGIHAIQSVLVKHPQRVKQIFLIQAKPNKRLAEIIQLANKHKCTISFLDKASFDKKFAGERQVHQGIAAEIAVKSALNENDLKNIVEQSESPLLLLVLDGITDPHNLGACLRSADAFGVDAVIIPKDKSVGLTASVCKVACGAAETVAFIQVTNLARTLQYLQKQGVWLYGAAGEAEQSLYQLELVGSTALVMGSEGSGLRRLTRDNCDGLFAIPMMGHVESLNVSVATGICLAEARRQRTH